MIPHRLAFALTTSEVPPADQAAKPAAPQSTAGTMSGHGISGGPLVGVTQIGKSAALLTGGRVGVTLDRLVFLGVMTEGTPLIDGFQSIMPDGRGIGHWQVGTVADVSPFDRALVHPRFGVALAGAWIGTESPRGKDSTFAVVVEPTATLELAVHRLVRVGATAGYRFSMPTTSAVSFAEASGLVTGLTVQIGLFD